MYVQDFGEHEHRHERRVGDASFESAYGLRHITALGGEGRLAQLLIGARGAESSTETSGELDAIKPTGQSRRRPSSPSRPRHPMLSSEQNGSRNSACLRRHSQC